MVDEEDADQPAPEEAARGAGQGAGHQVTDPGRDQQAKDHPEHEEVTDEPHAAVLVEILRVLLLLGLAVVGEGPADVGVEEALQHALDAAAVADMGAVRITLLVGVGVMLAMVGDPGIDRALHRHRPGDREEVFDRLEGLERAVGEQPVEADRDAEGREHVHAEEQGEVERGHDLVPEQDDRRDRRQKRDDHCEQVHDLVQQGHLVLRHARKSIVENLVFLLVLRRYLKQLL